MTKPKIKRYSNRTFLHLTVLSTFIDVNKYIYISIKQKKPSVTKVKKRKLCTSLTLDSARLQACACDILFSDVLVYCLLSGSILIFVRNTQIAQNNKIIMNSEPNNKISIILINLKLNSLLKSQQYCQASR